MLNSKLLGGVLLIVGTSIGGGMLALPLATAAAGITLSILFLFLCWLVMTAGAFLILEVNLRLPPGSNMISMAKSTLGLPGEIIAWVAYLSLLYTLLAAYISGGSDVFNALLQKIHIHLPSSMTSLLVTCILGFAVYSGIRTVDYINRGLMFGKLGIYLLLVLWISPHIQPLLWQSGTAAGITSGLMILITSFGFASIVPSLREYFQDDIPALRKVILVGSIIPLVCYILWDAIIMGVVQLEGEQGLIALASSDHATSELTEALNHALQNQWITGFFGFFTAICMITAFLGVSLGLFDFLADGLKLQKRGSQGKLILILTFLPPLCVVVLNPGIYLHALSYAGISCVILLLLLPSLMAWQGRRQTSEHLIFVPGGSWSLLFIALAAVGTLVINCTH